MKRTHYKGTREEARALNAYVKLMRAAETVTTRVHKHLAEHRLTVSQFGVLEALYHLGPMNQATIAKKILKSTGNITMIIDNLEKRGLLKREKDEKDRRHFRVFLTQDGYDLIQEIFPRHAVIIVREMAVLSADEQEELGRISRKLGVRQEKEEGGFMGKKLPIVKELGPGIYYWCRCGKTKDGAFCDGSHDEKDRGPLEFKVKEKKKVALCTCRKTKNAPVCDGTHVNLE